MFGRRVQIFTLFGFPVWVDASWLVIAALVTWSLASGLFPSLYKGLDQGTYWLMGAVGALGLFGSIILHEFSHSVVARSRGMPMKGITLFIFGGVAEMTDEPPNAATEFWMAIAGPAMSVLIAMVCFVAWFFGREALPVPVAGVLQYLYWVNGILVLFNIIPAFPLDGGRVLRSALWHYKGDLQYATRVTSRIGSTFGMFLMFMGLFRFMMGNPIGGLWMGLIGLFLRGAAVSSYQNLLVKKSLAGATVADFMQRQVVSVPPYLPLQDLVELYLFHYYHKIYPVMAEDKLMGFITVKRIKETPREDWPKLTARDVAEPCTDANTVTSGTGALAAMAKMNHTGLSRMLVVDKHDLVGVIALKDLMRFLSMRLELEGE